MILLARARQSAIPLLIAAATCGGFVATGHAAATGTTCSELRSQLLQADPASGEYSTLSAQYDKICTAEVCADLQKRIDRQSYTENDKRRYETLCRSTAVAPAESSGCLGLLKILMTSERNGSASYEGQAKAFASACPDWKAVPVADYEDPVLNDVASYHAPFADTRITDEEGRAAIEMLRRGIIDGKSDGELHGTDDVSRAEGLKMILLACGNPLVADATEPFRDVTDTDWYSPYVKTAYKLGVVTMSGGTALFKPSARIRRVEAATMITKACRIPALAAPIFRDVKATDWFAVAAGNAQTMGLYDFANKSFDGVHGLSRREMIVSLFRMLVYRDNLPTRCGTSNRTACIWRDASARIRSSIPTPKGLPSSR